ncbi:isoquinoline 1-oxidoreductase, beta subunit [Meinhardsimonia xiamenensis]|jgi:isoquinoline 1-oxidoreductase beta subunit|uniref:Isoquinoline 1-oxidoreductase, beta subunit n=1 Tax=Meinhardsimonia xiamenensis TaxID=990712 RepID=A0A1G9BIF7_9RHOB|nr:molybdopterin cofactor-binding domain-containing protein [Meinhardsimonia xiamenensis]PRX34969.1 isoquinoline 1-oxidoreductase beta subunit [Meinhardsimonia xiamenensis]SDK39243.1 isoquinoline 1-oxidoreductase, beta subunit [Meinhardsimonia xiamenensis]
MGTLRRLTRRSVLIGSLAVGGGVAFGSWAVSRPAENPLEEFAGADGAAFNPWVLVTPDEIRLITPHADFGQGAAQMQAMLIAEEMDLEPGQFSIDFGQPAKAYWNTALAEEGVPFMSTDESLPAEAMRALMGAAAKLMGLQITGGSTAVPDSFDKLRRAGAVARETLKRAAAARHGVHPDDLRTGAGAVILPDGARVPYTALAADAAKITPVTDVPLRPPAQWRLIGKPQPRLDMVAKCTGTQRYGIDVSLPGMIHAAVRMNPRKGGALKGFDPAPALAMPGVSDVIELPGGIAALATDTWTAMRAAEAVICEWGAAPYPPEQAGHWEVLAGSFTEDRLDRVWRDEGEVEAALADGAVISAEYRSPYVAHAPLEPLNATVLVTEEAVEVWTGHQIPRMLQRHVAAITGHGPEQVILHNQFIGGSFGHRLEFEFVRQAAMIAARKPGTPIKLTYSREEDFAQDFPRHIAMGRGRGVVREGRVEALDLAIAAPSVTASQMGRAGLAVPGPDAQIVAGAWNNPYDIPNFRVRGYRAPELAPVSSWRSVGAAGAGFFFDCFLDELIHAAGADPMAERIRLMRPGPARKVLEAVAQLSNWGESLSPGVGRGVAFVESFGVPVAEVVEVKDTPDGIRISRVWVAADVGRVVDPGNIENLIQGGVVFGLGHAMNAEITYSDGMAEQRNYHDHEAMRLNQCPEIFVRVLEGQGRVRGIGEPPVPPAAPALANAIFAATGKRIRELPLGRHVTFV